MNHEKNEINSLSPEELPRSQKEKIGEGTLEVFTDLQKKEKMLKHWAQVYRETERDFIKRDISRYNLKEYEKWEDDAKFAFDRIKELEEELDCSEDMYRRDNLEELAGTTKESDVTIEAFAGHFYDERTKALKNAIDSSDNKDKQQDKAKIPDFVGKVATFIEETKDKSGSNIDPNSINRKRQDAHNSVIWALNDLNHIAEKYGVKRLTFRDFEDNDFTYVENKDKYEDAFGKTKFGNTLARKVYDRRAVETYVRIAFDRDYRDVDEGNGDKFYNPEESIIRQFHG